MRIIIFSLLFLLSCDFDNGNSNTSFDVIPDNEIQSPVTSIIDSSIIDEQLKIFKKISESKEDIYASENRDLWQQPGVILDYLGDLSGKTLADIGAGPNGYFTFIIAAKTDVKKVIALDIDKDAIMIIDKYKNRLDESKKNKIETRLVIANDPQLKNGEVDFILVSNTLTYINDKLNYLKKLRKGLSDNGKILIIDSKMKKLPKIFPERKFRMSLYQMEELIEEAGFTHSLSDDMALNYQYIVLAKK